MSKEFKGNFCLLLAAVIWGAAFVAQSVSTEYVGAFTFQCVRSLLGCLVLLPVIAVIDRRNGAPAKSHTKQEHKLLWQGGIACGVILFIASNLQQFGISETSAGKAGFITALYIVLVPVAGLFFHKKAGWNVWCGVLLAACGLYLLCVTEGFSIARGDFLVFLCSVAFTAHILVIDHFSDKVDGVRMSCIQFLVNSILSGICMFLFESPKPAAILDCWLPIAYAGILSCGVGYTLQIVGQKFTRPTIASLLMSFESVFAVIFDWLILHSGFSLREIGGCILMFAAIILAQLPAKKATE
jgi:drug/metabolite transporter (DMT)-like permease